MLKDRLFFGTLMTLLFVSVSLLDGWLDGSLSPGTADDKKVQGTLVLLVIALVVVLSQREIASLFRTKGIKIFTPVTVSSSILFSMSWYLGQLAGLSLAAYIFLLGAFCLMAVFLYQYFFYGIEGAVINCGGSVFSIFYIGLLSGFCVAIRVEFGLWAMLMYIFVIKGADIGAYTIGNFFGSRPFSPRLSPGKSWEGMAGAIVTAVCLGIIMASVCGIMSWWLAGIFGFCFAFIGQLGDLAESLLKRDCERKDSAQKIPGFGGILDIIDSPLVAAPFAYLFFLVIL